MPLSLYEVSVVPILSHLNSLKKFIAKGQAELKDDSKITSAKLVADMGDFIYQIQRISDTSKGLAQRVAKVEPVTMPDTEKTIPELIARIDATIKVLEGVSPTSMDGMEDQEVVLKMGPGRELKFTGTDYVVGFAVPNFYFHYTMAYALLRKEGVSVGKKDFMGRT